VSFGMMGQLVPRMRQIVGIGDAPREGVIFGVEVEHPFLTFGEFVA